MTDVHALKEQYKDSILQDPNVSSVGVGLDDDGNEILIVGVKDETAPTSLPQDLSTAEFEIQEVGEFVPEVASAEVAPQADHQTRHRPVPGGVSTGHVEITAGTTSYLLTDGDTTYTASNAHVYANVNAGSPGDTIIQPGPSDGGTTSDQSATLEETIPLEDGTTVDLAWATPEVEHTTDLLDLTTPTGEVRRAEAGETVTKSGRTTAITEGTVNQVNVTVDVNYGDAGSITLDDQIITDDMSDGGDSGSAVVGTSDDAPVGLLFAGSDTATVLNQAVNVESESGLSIVTGSGGGGDPTPTANVTVTLERVTPDEGNITVTVENDRGSLVPDATVGIDGGATDSVQTDSTGTATFESIPIEEYTISVDAADHNSASVTIGAQDFE